MDRKGHENVEWFTGPEVEYTAAFGLRTLFVVGKKSLAEISELAKQEKVRNIYIGANRSLDLTQINEWKPVIEGLFTSGYFVTVDYPAEWHTEVFEALGATLFKNHRFIPMLSVIIPNVENVSDNLTLKIDDSGFNETNRGVWTLSKTVILPPDRFTGWQEYSSDVVIRPDAPAGEIIVEGMSITDALAEPVQQELDLSTPAKTVEALINMEPIEVSVEKASTKAK